MSRGTPALIGGLALVSLFLIAVIAAVVVLTGSAPAGEDGQPLGFFEADLVRPDAHPGRRYDGRRCGSGASGSLMLLVTLGGIFIVSTLIGVLTAGVEGKLEELRKGRSQVLESGHTLILGWSPQIFTILSELMIANENRKSARIVILADHDKVEMEDEIRGRVETARAARRSSAAPAPRST